MWLASEALTKSEITVGPVITHSGMANLRYAHDTCDETLHLLKGELTHTIGDQGVEMAAGDTLVVLPSVMHNALESIRK